MHTGRVILLTEGDGEKVKCRRMSAMIMIIVMMSVMKIMSW